jgi:hypothetical protein
MSASQVLARRDAEIVPFTSHDFAGLVLCAEHYAAPYDLLAKALAVRRARLYGIVARWRAAGYAVTGTPDRRTQWCWLTRTGMAACGLPYPARPPAPARLAYIRAALAARLWLESRKVYADGRARWCSDRRIRASLPSYAGPVCVPDAEIHWPFVYGSPYAGQVWAVRALTPKPAGRTERIMTSLLSPPRYARVVYLTAPTARRGDWPEELGAVTRVHWVARWRGVGAHHQADDEAGKEAEDVREVRHRTSPGRRIAG